MYRKMVFSFCFVLLSVAMVMAQDPASTASTASTASAGSEGDAKMVGGMSILGNDEAPKSLFIVPWKSSEMGVATSLNRTLDEDDEPVDRDVFQRELDFYQVSVGSSAR